MSFAGNKIEQERRIPFEITADSDPFFSKSNITELKRRLDAISTKKRAFLNRI